MILDCLDIALLGAWNDAATSCSAAWTMHIDLEHERPIHNCISSCLFLNLTLAVSFTLAIVPNSTGLSDSPGKSSMSYFNKRCTNAILISFAAKNRPGQLCLP